MKRLAITVGVALAAMVLSALPTVAASPFPPPVLLTDAVPNTTVAVAPGGSVTVMLVGAIPVGYDWKVTFVKADCNDDQHAQQNGGGGVFACFNPDLKPQPNTFGNGYVAYVEAPKVPTTITVTYACFPPYKDGAGEANNAVKVFEVTVQVQP